MRKHQESQGTLSTLTPPRLPQVVHHEVAKPHRVLAEVALAQKAASKPRLSFLILFRVQGSGFRVQGSGFMV